MLFAAQVASKLSPAACAIVDGRRGRFSRVLRPTGWPKRHFEIPNFYVVVFVRRAKNASRELV